MQKKAGAKAGKFSRIAAFALALAAASFAAPSALASCSSPAGNTGDVFYSSTNSAMVYCNGSSWIGMGALPAVGFGTLTTGDLCIATSGTNISCTSTLSGDVSSVGGNGTLTTVSSIGGKAVTLGGALTISGAYSLTLTTTASTSVTLPTSGTLLSTTSSIAASQITGILGVSDGGTGDGTLTTHGVLLGEGINPITATAAGTTGYLLTSGGAGADPTFSQLNLASSSVITGALGVANGGTGDSNLTTHGVLLGDGTNPINATSAGATGYLLTSGGAGADPTFSQLNLASSAAITGTLGVANGGTGLTTLTSNVIYKGNGTSALAASSLTDNGTIVSASESLDATSNGFVTEITNDGTTGTTANLLAKLTTAGAAIKAATTDTDGIVGIVTGGAGTSSNAQIAVGGQASCVFDGATTAGDFVAISTSAAGDCTDAGATRSPTSQTIGRVLSTNGGAGTYAVALGLNASSNAGATTALGTSTTTASPRISGDATSGFYTAGAAKVDVTISGTQIAEWNAGGFNVVSGSVGIGTTSPATGMKADINGPIKVAGTGSETCSASTIGAIRYNSTGNYLEICSYP